MEQDLEAVTRLRAHAPPDSIITGQARLEQPCPTPAIGMNLSGTLFTLVDVLPLIGRLEDGSFEIEDIGAHDAASLATARAIWSAVCHSMSEPVSLRAAGSLLVKSGPTV